MTPTTDLQPTPRQRNWAPWIAVLLALIAILSNAGFFLGLTGQRAIPWLSVPLAIAALVCAAVGIMRAFRQSKVYGGKISSSILGVLSLLICGLVALASITSRALPAATNAPQVGQKVPDFTLADTNGNRVSLDQLLGKSDGGAVAANEAKVDPKPEAADPKLKAVLDSTPAKDLPQVMPLAPPKAVLLVFYRGYW